MSATKEEIHRFQQEISRHHGGAGSIMIKQDGIEFVPMPYKLDDDNHMMPVSENAGDYSYATWVHMRRVDGGWVRVLDLLDDAKIQGRLATLVEVI